MPIATTSFDSYLAPPAVQQQILDLMVSGSTFARRLTPLPTASGKVVFPVANPTGTAWVAENDPLPTINPQDDSVLVAAAKIAGLLGLSNESLDDASFDLAAAVGAVLRDSMATDVDAGLLFGDQPPEPAGVWAVAPSAGAGADFREAAITAWGELVDAGGNPASIVVFAKGAVVAAEWARTSAGSGDPAHGDSAAGANLTLGPGIQVQPCPVMNATDVLAVDVSRCFFVIRQGITVEASPHAGWANDQTILRIKGRVGVAAPVPAKTLRKVVITTTPLASSSGSKGK